MSPSSLTLLLARGLAGVLMAGTLTYAAPTLPRFIGMRSEGVGSEVTAAPRQVQHNQAVGFTGDVELQRHVTGRLSGGIEDYVVAPGDTLTRVGARFGVSPAVLVRDNGLDVRATLHIGQTLRIDNRHIVPRPLEPGMILINLPQRILFYIDDAGPLTFPIAVGRRDWRTPLGAFFVATREEDPTWDVPRSILEEARRAGHSLPAKVPPGPANPLGKFWLGLSMGSVGIHGTNAPSSIYRAATHGCIRLHPDDIAQLFSRVRLGTEGRITYEPLLLEQIGLDVFLEVHPDVYSRVPRSPREVARELAGTLGLTDQIDWVVADAVIVAKDGIARRVTRGSVSSE